MNQGQLVTNIIVNTCEDKGIEATKFETKYSDAITQDVRAIIHSQVFEGLKDGSIPMTAKNKDKYLNDLSELSRYASALISDRLRKNVMLNGGVPYKPATKAGPRDAELKALKQAYLLVQDDPEKAKVVEDAIEKRKQELNVKKEKEVDLSALDPELKAALGL